MIKEAKKVFSRIGLSLIAILVIGTILQIAAASVLSMTPEGSRWMKESSLGMMVTTFVPLYLVAFPLGILLMKKIPVCPGQKKKLSLKEWLTYAVMCIPIMYLGNILGTILSGMLSGGQAQNAVQSLLQGSLPEMFLFVVILGPFFEELIFRKLIIDKTVCYGEKIAVLFSALTFGLFHGNLFQFFYSFGVGFIWAYVYVKTGKFSYVYGLHALFNFMGGIIPSMLIAALGEDGLNQLETMDAAALAESERFLIILAIYGIYFILLVALNVVGLVLLVRKRKSFVFEKAGMINKRVESADTQAPEEEEVKVGEKIEAKVEEEGAKVEEVGLKTALVNVGMIIFILVILLVFSLALL